MLVFVTKATATSMEGVTPASRSHLTRGNESWDDRCLQEGVMCISNQNPCFPGEELRCSLMSVSGELTGGGADTQGALLTRFRCRCVGWHLTLRG